MKSLLFTATIVFSGIAYSESAFAQQACYEKEKNVSTKNMYTEEEWTLEVAGWDAQEPADPGIIALYSGWTVNKTATAEISGNKNFKGDKRKHCYVGCRISQEVSVETAMYAAWYKEKKDLTDCVEASYFELRDHEATVHGAKLGEKSADPQYCLDECVKLKRY